MNGALRRDAMEVYDFLAGTNTRLYDMFGVKSAGEDCLFRCYAPRARRVSVSADFLPGGRLSLREIGDGIWEASARAEVPPEGMRYCYWIDGVARCDPFARRGMWGEEIGSLISEDAVYPWQDGAWMERRGARRAGNASPMNLYEVHLSSFATRHGRSNTAGDAYLNYRELGERLAAYASDMGYTHIKLMPLTEHRYDASHGYVTEAYFAPTSRHGTPNDLRAMIDMLHRAGLGVVMDLPVGGEGEDERTRDPSSPAEQSFLLSAVMFWLREFHLDGLCLVGMRRWAEAGGETYAAAVRLLTLLCAAAHAEFPDVYMMAEEDIGAMTGEGSVGFDLLCHSRFAGDLLRCLHTDPSGRPYLRDLLSRSVSGAAEEQYFLSLSHERVSAGHSSLIGQMWGGYLRKFEGVRLALAFQMVHPGKKLLFMGCELGQRRAWDDRVPPDWFLSELEPHACLLRYVRAINRFYREQPCLWRCERAEWAEVSAVGASEGAARCLLAWRREDGMGDSLLVLLNFSDERISCRLPSEGIERFRIVFHTDHPSFGGEGRIGTEQAAVTAEGMPTFALPGMTAVFLAPIPSCEKKDAAEDR